MTEGLQPPLPSQTGAHTPPGAAARLRQLLDPEAETPVAELATFWRSKAAGREPWEVDAYRQLARWFLEAGQPILAYDVASDGLIASGGDTVLRQIQGLALARTGATEKAREVLAALRDEGNSDEETLGILARTYKDLALRSTDHGDREAHLRQALAVYEHAHRTTGGYWTGINVATLHLFLGGREQAQAAAAQVRAQCLVELEKLEADGGDTYWVLATLGEAALLCGEWAEAEDYYQRAVAVCGGEWGNVSTTRRQARLIMGHLAGDHAPIESCLRVPSVVVFAGHMMDRPDRTTPRFPPDLEPEVKRAILGRLRELNAGFGYSSGACGSDLLFQECLREIGGRPGLVLPYPEADFIKDSVDLLPGSAWVGRFEEAVAKATETVVASPHRLTWGGVTYDYANHLLLGRAMMHARQLETDLVPLAVWDGSPGDGPGGTASIVERWRKLGHKVEAIPLRELAGAGFPAPAAGIGPGPPRTLLPIKTGAPAPLTPKVRAILFADMVGFGGLDEQQIIAFLQRVLKVAGEFAAETEHTPEIRNTWGDGLFCAFETVRAAALFALGLRDQLDHALRTEKRRAGEAGVPLPENLAWRIGLHAGPVFPCTDPFTAEPTYLGAHVNLAARIEPVTPPGEIFASWAFAALASADQTRDFACDYAGVVPCAKSAGPLRMYRVRRV